jgi:hypothetical protein
LNWASAKIALTPLSRTTPTSAATWAALGSCPGASTIDPSIVSPYAAAKYGNASWNEITVRFSAGIVSIRERISASRSVSVLTYAAVWSR